MSFYLKAVAGNDVEAELCSVCFTTVVMEEVHTHDWRTQFRDLWQAPRVSGYPICELLVLKCPQCKSLALKIVAMNGKDSGTFFARTIYPYSIRPSMAPDTLDAAIKKAYDEARHVLVFSPMSAAVLARRCVQHTIRTKMAIKAKDLFSEIAEAIKSDLLSRPTKDSLDHIRTIGNWGAHPCDDQANTLIEVSSEDATYTLDTLEMLFNDLYVAPARAAKMKASIAAKKK